MTIPASTESPMQAAEQKPTPGPWTVSEPWSGFSAIYGPDGGLVFGLAAGCASEKRDDATCEANARLLAAAPKMYEALRAFVAAVDRSSGTVTFMIGNSGCSYDQARAAINEAEGRS